MLSKALIVVALAFLALGALRFAMAPPRPRWVQVSVIGIAVALPLLFLKLGVVAVVAGGLAAAGIYFRPQPAPPEESELQRARRVLEVGEGATEAEIRAAHRRKIASAHPDRGGKPGEASALNAARDLLIRSCRARR